MNVDEEFETVDAVIASKADTYSVDAFALSLIKNSNARRGSYSPISCISIRFSPWRTCRPFAPL